MHHHKISLRVLFFLSKSKTRDDNSILFRYAVVHNSLRHSFCVQYYSQVVFTVVISMQLISNQLERINAVRENLDVLYLSEICELNGTKLARGFYYGNAGDKWYTRFQAGPKQTKPNSYSWKFWRRILNKVLKPSSLKLRKPLEDWKSNHSTHGYWKAYLSDQLVYKHQSLLHSLNVYYLFHNQFSIKTIFLSINSIALQQFQLPSICSLIALITSTA